MNRADSDRIHELCTLISVEKDRARFLEFVQELNQLLNKKEESLPPDQDTGSELNHKKLNQGET